VRVCVGGLEVRSVKFDLGVPASNRGVATASGCSSTGCNHRCQLQEHRAKYTVGAPAVVCEDLPQTPDLCGTINWQRSCDRLCQSTAISNVVVGAGVGASGASTQADTQALPVGLRPVEEIGMLRTVVSPRHCCSVRM
jgi:hypothetical protein